MQRRPHIIIAEKSPKLEGVVNYTMYSGGGGVTILCFLSADLYKTILVQKFHQSLNLSQTVTSEVHMCSPVAKGLKKCKKECNIPKLFWYKVFVH